MTTYYVDPAATGSNDGTSWTDAWTNPQSAFDAATAGDKVYLRGTYTYTAATSIAIDTNAGDLTSGMIEFIGCNASGVVDGTRFVFDGNSQACALLTTDGTADYILLQNIEVKNAGSGQDGLYVTSSSDGWLFNNCSFHDNGAYGVSAAGNLRYGLFLRCAFYSNSNSGVYTNSMRYVFCSFHDNSSFGTNYPGNTLYGCIAYDNGTDGFGEIGSNSTFINCISDGNGDNGIEVTGNTSPRFPFVMFSRITNHNVATQMGIDGNDDPLCTIGCYFQDNDGDNIQNDLNHYNLSLDGTETSSNQEDQGDTIEGYTSVTDDNEDYNLASGATMRRTEVSIPIT